MAATEVQALDDAQRQTLDTIIRPHLRLDSMPEDTGRRDARPAQRLEDMGVSFKKPETQQVKRGTSVLQGTIEADNKRRPGILKRNSTRYQPPPLEPPDPNSEAKSAVIGHMQQKLENWDQQLQDIVAKKKKNDKMHKSEVAKRDESIKDLTERYTNETDLRVKTENERDDYKEQLEAAREEIETQHNEMQQLHSELVHCQVAYEQTESRRLELEEQNVELLDKLEQIEGMKKRLNDVVTELQGQLAIVEQRSNFCSIS